LLVACLVQGRPADAQAPAERRDPAARSAPPGAQATEPSTGAPRGAGTAAQEPRGPELEEKTSVTRHTIRIAGQPVAYTATAGTLVLRDDAAKPVASFFYVWYTRDNVADVGRRPIVYSFNGGPGTASIWMHLGFTGPRRVLYDEDGFMLQPPYGLHDNEHSILDIADIVYIDPVGTGFSRMAPGEDPHKFHGVLDDIKAMADFIRVFTIRQGRWKSPKFLIGESYGTTRASGLVGYLQSQHQMYVNGVILVSMTNLGFERGTDLGYATALPYMTATAWYHKKLPADLQGRPLKEALGEVERFASGEYQVALFRVACCRPASAPRSRRQWRASRACRRSSFSRATCAWSGAASGRSCCATGGSPWDGSTAVTPASTRTPPARTPRAIPPCGTGTGRSRGPSTPTSATS